LSLQAACRLEPLPLVFGPLGPFEIVVGVGGGGDMRTTVDVLDC
jgi:hypothetical protein